MQNQPVGLHSSGRERQPSEMLKDLILRWFLESQADLLLQDGRLPDWFHGFLSRPEAEKLLEDREIGSFLIRLNEKAFGYILSYRPREAVKMGQWAFSRSVVQPWSPWQRNARGKDRCRHFVINCQRSGRYIVSGDTQTHADLAELIGYYQGSEIQPFGETLTSACPQPGEKSIYDEISSDRSPSADVPTLSRSPSADVLVTQNHFTNQPECQRISVPEEQKSLFKERQHSKEDPDVAPPIPDRSRLLESLSLEERVGEEGTIYSAVKKHPLDKRSLGKSKEWRGNFGDTKAKEPVGVGQGPHNSPCQRKTGTVFGMAKQTDVPFAVKANLAETAQPDIIYSGVVFDQPKSFWISAEPHSYQSTFPSSKKPAVPSYPLSKLSPTLLNKSKSSVVSLDSSLGINTRSVGNKEHGPLNQPKSLLEPPKERTDEKVKNTPSPLWMDDTTNPQESFRWAKSIFHGSEKPPKASLTRSKGSYDQISKMFGHASKFQINPGNPYEKEPDPYTQRYSTTSQATSLEDPYEQIPYQTGKRIEGKVTPKSEKPRRFHFAEKKAKS